MTKIGAQMFTLRDFCATPDDIARTLERVKAMGYDGIQGSSAGFNTLDEGELKPVSYTHLRAHETGRNLVCRLLLEKTTLCNAGTVSYTHLTLPTTPYV